jgi:uncharacterized protein
VLPADGATAARRAFHVMAKPTGAVCNLDCTYCFYLAKESLYPGSDFRMSDGVLDEYVRQLLQAHAGMPEVVVAFQGGEPTMMGLDFFAKVVDAQRRHAAPGQQVLLTLQTNATLLDDDWGAFLAQHGVLVGVSIDGPRELHDAYRVDKGGKPSFDRVMKGLDALRRHGVEWNALVTVNRANQHRGAEVYRFLRDELGAGFMQFIPVVERTPTGASAESVEPAAYGRFMVEVFEEWVRRDVGSVFVQAFDTALAHWLDLDGVGLCVHEETCGRSVALEHNGDLYSCDHFVSPEHRLGNIADGRTLLQLVDSPAQRAFGDAKRSTLTAQCRSCDVRFACHGGCPKDRFLTTATGEPGLHYLCDGYLNFFRHIDPAMRYMAGRYRQGLDVDGVMSWYERRAKAAAVSPIGERT